MERLGSENGRLAEELGTLRKVASGWEAQAQDNLAYVERLKEMLEEAASWSGGAAAGATVSGYMAAVNNPGPSECRALFGPHPCSWWL